ncbi:TlpA family protein disulfide reductase [Oceanobacillus piezotolerans]|uniref:TlpA family protein disulfide reductase n=1 Tax=Oceanobacillus piezotolerans TaxID=2448030 RepID=UPI0013142249|nr:TlpA disulfide reductase family protein [Oceanobacillus piezotolerans]
MKLNEKMPVLKGYTNVINHYSENEGKDMATLIHFWSVSCSDCKRVLPKIAELKKQYQGKLHVIAIHMPRSKQDMDIKEVERMARKYNLTEPILIDNDYNLSKQFNIRFVPSYFLFDHRNNLRHYQATKRLNMLLKRIERIVEDRR